MPKCRNRAGFTLVELLVVIGIIAVLMSLLLPAVNRAREQSKQIVCLNNLRQLGMAFLSYANENQGRFPAPARYSSLLPDDWIYWEPGQAGRPFGRGPLIKYIGSSSESTFRCPSDDIYYRGGTIKFGGYRYSYSMNEGMVERSSLPSNFHGLRIGMVHSPATKILLFEEDEHSIDDGYAPMSPTNEPINMLAIRHDFTRREPDNQANFSTLNGSCRGNVVFGDAHAEFINRNIAHTPASYDPTY